MDRGIEAFARMALIETVLAVTFRAAEQCERSVAHVRQHALGDRFVIMREVELGDFLCGVKNPVGMGETDAGNFVIRYGPGARRLSDRSLFLAPYLRRWFVLAQALERRMAKNFVLGPTGKSDFADQFRLDPVNALAQSARQFLRKRRCLAFELVHARMQISQAGVGKSGADPTGIAQGSVIFIDTQKQRAEIRPRAGRIGVAGDNEFLAAHAFDFQPIAAAPGPMRLVAAFRNNSLQARSTGLLKKLIALTDPMLTVTHARGRAGEQLLQNFLALQQPRRA